MALFSRSIRYCLHRFLTPSTIPSEFAVVTHKNYSSQKKPPEENMINNLLKCKRKTSSVVGQNVAYVGGYGGIGFACCIELICKGIKKLCILDIRDDCPKAKYLKSINPELDLKFVRMNLVTGEDEINSAIKKAYDHMGYIDILINGAGIINDRAPELTVDINLMGLMRCTFATIPFMSKANGGKGGTIIHMASMLGLVPCHCIAIYTATKWGVIGFARSLCHDHYFDIDGIKHLILCPGPTDTPHTRSFVTFDTFDYSKPLSEKYAKVEKQLPIDCAIGILQAIEKAKHGSIWTIIMGEACPLEMTNYFEFKFKT